MKWLIENNIKVSLIQYAKNFRVNFKYFGHITKTRFHRRDIEQLDKFDFEQRKIVLNGYHTIDLNLAQILRKFPNLTSFETENKPIIESNDIFPLIIALNVKNIQFYNLSKHFPNLESLIFEFNCYDSVFSFTSQSIIYPKFSNLLSLNLKIYDIQVIWLNEILQQCPKLEELKTFYNDMNFRDNSIIHYPLLKSMILLIDRYISFDVNFQRVLSFFPNLQTFKLIYDSFENYNCDRPLRTDNELKYSYYSPVYITQNILDICKYGISITSLQLPKMKLTDEIVQSLIDMSSQLRSLKLDTTHCENVSKEMKKKFYEKYYKM